MHDWTLAEILFDWRAARVTLSFRRNAGVAMIVAEGVSRLDVAQANEWGPSVSVNRIRGPAPIDGSARGQRRLTIEMQSGDVITMLAASFILPDPLPDQAASLATAAVGK